VLRERVTVQLGSFKELIPAGSFVRDGHGGFIFERKDGRGIKEMRIGRDGRFEIEGRGASLGLINPKQPVLFKLQIGNDLGQTSVRFEDRGKKGDRGDKEHSRPRD